MACQRMASAHAVWSTQAPIGRIRPVSSATGTSSAGAISPRIGLRQRSKASMPLTAPLERFSWG